MGLLHELLAVEQDLKAEAGRVMSEVSSMFKDGSHHLIGQSRIYRPLEEGGNVEPDENVELSTTVGKQFDLVRETYGKYLDVTIQKELTNTEAFASISGLNISFDELPATAMLNLEARLGEIRKLITLTPTLDPLHHWEWDSDLEAYVSNERIQFKTEKRPEVLVRAEATEQHPAQTEVFHKDVRIGEWTNAFQCGLIPAHVKRGYLRRIELLITEVKKARQRANSVEIKTVAVADEIFDFIFKE